MASKYKDPFDITGPELTYPLSLSDGLSRLTKQQLMNIGKLLAIGGLSSLNKAALIDKLAFILPEHLEKTFRLWDLHRQKIIQKAVKNNGRITGDMEDLEYYEYFMDRGILFPTYINDNEAFLVPEEIVVWLKQAGITGNHDIIHRNTEWIQLSMGALYYYGALTFEQLDEIVFTHAENQVEKADFPDILNDALEYYAEMESDDFEIFYYYSNDDPESILEEHKLRAQLEFYPFTRQQLLQAGKPDFSDKPKHYQDFVRYLMTTYQMDREMAVFLVDECVSEIYNLALPSELINTFTEWIEFSTIAEASALSDRITQLYNHTRQWALKGYSPEELSAKRNRKPATISQMPNRSGRADVISFETKKKIGRNDPCPCGSGAKFKKCCGK